MQLTQMGYLGIASTDVRKWRAYATDMLGLQCVDASDGMLALRMDERQQRFLVVPSDRDGLAWMGFEVADAAALQQVARELEAAKVAFTQGAPKECDARGVAAMLWCNDPEGNRVEFYHGPKDAGAFKPSRPIGGFRTGDLGYGHIAMGTKMFDAMIAFYTKVLGLRLSDYVTKPVRGQWFHINPRHHTMAIVEGDHAGVHHMMVEYNQLDDVGRLHDMALREPGLIQTTLGRHSNDHMLSFYCRSPSGFMIETGWGGRLVDDATWTPSELYGFSVWGHDRLWMPPELREIMWQNLGYAAREGILEPVAVNNGPGFDFTQLKINP